MTHRFCSLTPCRLSQELFAEFGIESAPHKQRGPCRAIELGSSWCRVWLEARATAMAAAQWASLALQPFRAAVLVPLAPRVRAWRQLRRLEYERGGGGGLGPRRWR